MLARAEQKRRSLAGEFTWKFNSSFFDSCGIIAKFDISDAQINTLSRSFWPSEGNISSEEMRTQPWRRLISSLVLRTQGRQAGYTGLPQSSCGDCTSQGDLFKRTFRPPLSSVWTWFFLALRLLFQPLGRHALTTKSLLTLGSLPPLSYLITFYPLSLAHSKTPAAGTMVLHCKNPNQILL